MSAFGEVGGEPILLYTGWSFVRKSKEGDFNENLER